MKLVSLLSLCLVACAQPVAFSSNSSCQPPAAPAASACSPAPDVSETFAVDRLLLGDTTRDGTPAEDAWRTYGYDLDGKLTDRHSKDVCTRAPGAAPDAQIDGASGIDNAWGNSVVPFIEALFDQASPSRFATDAIVRGGPTLELTVHGLSAERAQTAIGLRAEALSGAGSVAFNEAYVNGGVFVSGGSEAPLVLDVAVGGALFSDGSPAREVLELVVHDAIITFERPSSDAIEGTIAGVLDVEELVAAAGMVARRVAPSLCGDDGFDVVAARLRQAADILVDGENQAGVPCSGISLGIGFSARRIASPTPIAPAPRPRDPCVR